MLTYNSFIKSLLPGNYALTKSMELTKAKSSGTLWYTKKYLVLYYYVFLSPKIETNEYVEGVIKAFDTYINSLDTDLRESAEKYFYSDDSWRNFKSDKFVKFMTFANKTDFDTADEKSKYIQSAKNCYFALLMATGGQSAVKKRIIYTIRTALNNGSFSYSPDFMKNIILNAVAEECIEKINKNQSLRSGDIARILSSKAFDEIEQLAKTTKPETSEVIDIINSYPCSQEYPGYYSNEITKAQFSGVESDCFASVRNERQILYYYGYFHSKSYGARDFEFSSLTPIGELALTANAPEFLAIWEQQKLKMISQPPTAEINDLSPCII